MSVPQTSVPQTIGRREFVTRVAMTAASAGAVGSLASDVVAATPPVNTTTISLQTATAATFQKGIGQKFKVAGVDVVLEKVEVIPDRNKDKRPRKIRSQSFSLLFSAPAGARLADGIHSFSGSKLGRFTVYTNQVRLLSTFSTKSALGQAELYLGSVAANVQATPAKDYFEVPFN